MALCYLSSGNTSPAFMGSLPHAVPHILFPRCPRYLPPPLLALAVSPERSCSPQQLTAGSVSSLLPGSAALQGPSHSKRPRDTCFGHPSHRRKHSNQPRMTEKWRQHMKGEQRVFNTFFKVYCSILGPSDHIFKNLVPSLSTQWSRISYQLSLTLLLCILFQLNSLISLQHPGLRHGNKGTAVSTEHPDCLRGQS